MLSHNERKQAKRQAQAIVNQFGDNAASAVHTYVNGLRRRNNGRDMSFMTYWSSVERQVNALSS